MRAFPTLVVKKPLKDAQTVNYKSHEYHIVLLYVLYSKWQILQPLPGHDKTAPRASLGAPWSLILKVRRRKLLTYDKLLPI